MNLKEFFEKRWWTGVGAAAGIAAIVLSILQYRGIDISLIHISIAANIVLGIALAIIARQARKWKRKYEDANSRLEKIMAMLEKRAQGSKRKGFFLPDINAIWKLNIDNALLTQLHGQALGLAVTKFQDAKLCDFDIIVNPYQNDRVSILFRFYCGLADRACIFIIGEQGDWHESLPSEPVIDELHRITFNELPWLSAPDWLQFLRKSCEKVGPLSPATWTQYHMATRAYMNEKWSISFKDGVTGAESNFSWDGKGEPTQEERIKGAD